MRARGLILIGAGGHAQACIDVIEQHARFRIEGLIGVPAEVGSTLFGYPIIAADDQLLALSRTYHNALIAVGQIRTPETRIRLFEVVKSAGFKLPSIVSPTAYISQHASVGTGTIVMHGAIINAGAKVGNNCIINSRALIEHDVIVGDHCHVSTGAILNGNVSVGAGSFLVSGSVVREGVSLGQRCLVGMGAMVRRNQADGIRFVA
jgi:sugar O-acyltransferase (sialic acid O-acetyltransferase NeuD family)